MLRRSAITREASPAVYRRALLLLLLAGLALRLLGIGWGMPGRTAPDQPPIHPDEHVVWHAAESLYATPPPVAFVYGGALYPRTGWLVRGLVRAGVAPLPPHDYAATLIGLRLLNVAAALASAVLLAAVARRLLGPFPALGAVALYLFFPVTVLDAHYARPDVLAAALTTGSLAAAVAMARTGDRRWLALGGVCAGLASAALLSGLIGLTILTVAAIERERGQAVSRWLGSAFRAAPWIAGGALAGWLLGSFESLLHLEAWRGGLAIAASTHNEGGWSFPVAQLGSVSFYAFGSVAALAGFAGIAVLVASRTPGSLAVVAQWLCGYILLARVGGDMLQHQEVLAAPMAISAAAALSAAMRALAGPARARAATAAALALAAVLSLQLSLAYVWPLQFAEDPRDRAGRWLAENTPPGARVGFTASFFGDHTYAPRLPSGHRLFVEGLMLRRDFDSSRYLEAGLDYIATSDFARERAEGDTAPAFFDALFGERRYRIVGRFGPDHHPSCLPDWLGSRRPGDLLYVRPTVYVFQRSS